MNRKQPSITAAANQYIRPGEAVLLLGLSAKTIAKIAAVNHVRVRKIPGLQRGTTYHRNDLLALLAAADVGAAVRSSA